MLPSLKNSRESRGFIHFIPLLAVTIIILVFATLLPKRATYRSIAKPDVLSEEKSDTSQESEEDNENDDKPKPTEIEDGDDLEDSDEEGSDKDDNEEEDENEIEELEFEDGEDESENEVETEEEKLVEGDSEQKVELESENGIIKIKIKTKTFNGREIEKELEATGSATIASLNLKIRNGQIKLKVKSEGGKIVLVEENNGEETQASTDLPITIDSENNLVIIHTPSGNVNLTEFPSEIFGTLLASRNLDTLEKLELKIKTEDGKTKLVYHAQGKNEVKLFGMFKLEAGIETDVDPNTGTLQTVSQPWYLKYLSFIFSN